MAAAADFLTAAVIIGAVAYGLMVGAEPDVTASSSAYRQVSVYRQAAAENFKQLKNRTKLTLDESAIIRDLQEQYPEITGGVVDLRIIGHTPTIRLDIAAPSFMLNSQGEEYIINSRGVAAARRSELPHIKNLLTIHDESGFNISQGQQILAASEVDFIETLLQQSRRAKVPISILTLPPRAMELDVRTADAGYYTKFYLGGDALVQTGQFLAARRQFDRTSKKPAIYLDVRVPGKIYYK